jgi:hypothetical protein
MLGNATKIACSTWNITIKTTINTKNDPELSGKGSTPGAMENMAAASIKGYKN